MLSSGAKPFTELSYEELLTHGYAVVGSPDTVANRLGALQSELGFGQIIGLFAIGGMSHEQTVTSTELFAAEVMPALKALGTTPAG
jgi:alkanesulfonate monooxygenase SsuD/methylene tetrahydromethanopterin reductase-like flavin-dependent oxidoreductase (luciferase family)